MAHKYDFSGWATKNNLRCSDGRTIRKDAFKDNDGQTVPLVWQHQHGDPTNVLGHALLENREEGVYTYCTFNDTEKGQHAKALVEHGDVVALSIYANQLQQRGGDVLHGAIKEVSLVLAGANPGALIDFPMLAHSDDDEFDVIEDEATIFTGEPISLAHADDEAKEDNDMSGESDKTIKEIFDTLNEEQKTAVYAVIGMAIDGDKEDADDEVEHSDIDDEGDTEMKHNVFDASTAPAGNYLSHSDEEKILMAAKKGGSFRNAFEQYMEDNSLQHDDDPVPPAAVSGFTSYPSGATPAGVDALFPEWHDVRPGAPELVTDELTWVDVVLRKVHKSPFSRIRTSHVDIRHIDDLRARGYVKGTKKEIVGNYSVARRTTDPQTVYVKSALNRDDIVDITDFDYVAYQYQIDKLELNEELATAILIGDGRADGADGKIEPTHIRPIWGDDALYTIYKDLGADTEMNGTDTQANFGENYILAESAIAAILDAKIAFRGTGTPDMYCTQQFINKMLLAKDMNGRRIYANKGELATALGVGGIYPVSKLAGKTRTAGEGQEAKTMVLDAILVNLADYAMGSTKGGQITHFNQFDIDFNQEKSLLETRVSGANTRIYSAIVLEHEQESDGE